jgi:FkbM family methyltransferase
MTENKTLPSRRFSWLINCLLVLMQKLELSGKHRLYLWLSKHNANKVIKHKLGGREFVVPVDEWCFWLERGPQNYYLDEFIPFFKFINQIDKPFTFFDLGADIGTVSALAKQYCANLHTIYAFEPNQHSYALLSHNLSQLDKPYIAENAAVSNLDAYVAFHSSSTSTIDHEGSIDVSTPGSTRVYSLDNWLSAADIRKVLPYIVLKIDVEGQELQVIQGAAKLIQQAEVVTVLLEIHPDVLQQTATTAEQLFCELEKLRAFNWYVPKLANQVIDRDREFFAQFPRQQFDIIGCSIIAS